MKKILSIGLIFIITNSAFADQVFNTSLKYGAKGENVVEMQEFLIDQGHLSGSATGNFYSVTLRAVKAFQLKNGISASGFWGPATRAKANSLVALSEEEKVVSVPQQVVPQVQQNTQSVPVQQNVSSVVVPVQSTLQSVVEVKEYKLLLSNFKTNPSSTNFTPTATLNGKNIKVTRCWITSQQEGVEGDGLVRHITSNDNPAGEFVAAIFATGDGWVKQMQSGGGTTCRLEDGKVLTN